MVRGSAPREVQAQACHSRSAVIGVVYAGFRYRGAHRMSWLGIVLVVIGLVLALKMAGFVMKLAMWALVLFGLYWFLAPRLGLPWPF
jgi:hypothetical protein